MLGWYAKTLCSFGLLKVPLFESHNGLQTPLMHAKSIFHESAALYEENDDKDGTC